MWGLLYLSLLVLALLMTMMIRMEEAQPGAAWEPCERLIQQCWLADSIFVRTSPTCPKAPSTAVDHSLLACRILHFRQGKRRRGDGQHGTDGEEHRD
jgi:hypothetical protein